MTCPPCNNNCDQGRTCPAKNKIIEEDDDIQEYKRPWVGLTEEDFYGQSELQRLAMKYAEAKLKERNT
ncbi:MAG: hypothetical protein RIS97_1191 [Pseudomonadota bacterium]|jgi:hypothetical protein